MTFFLKSFLRVSMFPWLAITKYLCGEKKCKMINEGCPTLIAVKLKIKIADKYKEFVSDE